MGKIKGQKEYLKFESGASLTRKQAMLAQCYSCNGFEASNCDCLGKSCPLYQYMPFKGKKTKDRASEANQDTETLATA